MLVDAREGKTAALKTGAAKAAEAEDTDKGEMGSETGRAGEYGAEHF